VISRDPEQVKASIGEGLAAGETDFVAVGGDGTVNLLASCLVDHISDTDLRRVRLGAIGLGSSNDFHKPMQEASEVGGAPCRLDFRRAALNDVCLVTYRDEAGRVRHRPWIINSSIGTTAEANGFFNRPDRILRFLKRAAPGAAIAYAAIHTLLQKRSQELILTLDGQRTIRRRVANLGVVKNPHFTGILRYDSPHEPESGHFYVHLLSDLSLPRLVLALARLARGHFAGQIGARSWRACRLVVRSDTPFALEGDGEVVFAREASYCVMPRLFQLAA
jgi:diacylglycerol kinase family enzyme